MLADAVEGWCSIRKGGGTSSGNVRVVAMDVRSGWERLQSTSMRGDDDGMLVKAWEEGREASVAMRRGLMRV